MKEIIKNLEEIVPMSKFEEFCLNEIKLIAKDPYIPIPEEEFYIKLHKIIQTICDLDFPFMTKTYLGEMLYKLLNESNLSPLEDNKYDWEERVCYLKNGNVIKVYNHKRRPSLVKNVFEDGTTKIFDSLSYESFDLDRGIKEADNYLTCLVMSKALPIRFPYVPPARPHRLYISEDIIADKNGSTICLISPEFIVPIVSLLDNYESQKVNMLPRLAKEFSNAIELNSHYIFTPDAEYYHLSEKEYYKIKKNPDNWKTICNKKEKEEYYIF